MAKISKNITVRKSFEPVVVRFHKHSNDEIIRYQKSYDSHLNSVYVEVGRESISSYVNSFKSMCCLEDILRRCSLMPLTDKVKMLQQRETFSGSEVGLPTDLTDAFEKLNSLKKSNPDLVKRIQSGEDFKSIMDSIINSNTVKEDVVNGPDESSND